MRVLHVLHHSLPVVDGYSLRSRYTFQHQQALGLTLAAVTSAQQADDSGRPAPPGNAAEGNRLTPAVVSGDRALAMETIDGIDYFRTPPYGGPAAPLIREALLMRALGRSIEAACRTFRPDVIHAHSPVLVGSPALRVAHARGIPFVYEIRDLWENASVDRGKFSETSVWYRLARGFDTRVLRRADAVVAICEALGRDLAPRLSAPDRLFIVPNGVDSRAFAPSEGPPSGSGRFTFPGKDVVGYIGSFQPYEGLDLLVSAVPALVRARPSAHVLIVGGGDTEPDVRRLADKLGVTAHVTFTGRVPHGAVREAYASADVLVYPRHLTRTTALTTPLKPLEAMAMGKAVVVSDVAAMRELVEPSVTGLTFRAGDAGDLAAVCARLLADPAARVRLGQAARQWVQRERDWSRTVARYLPIYNQLVHTSSGEN